MIWAEFIREDDVPLPAGTVTADMMIAEAEQDAESRALLADARRFIQTKFYAAKSPTVASLRLSRGWSQKQLAETVGTSQPYVARLEMGRVDPQLSTLRRFADALGVSTQEFIEAIDGKESR